MAQYGLFCLKGICPTLGQISRAVLFLVTLVFLLDFGSKKRAPRVRGQSALVLSLCESFYAALVLGLRRSIPGGGLRVRLLRRAYW
jgi:hypothetical protein